jgi:ubiquinol-cytochrome c reductase iron-sulfur subunit
MRRSTSSAERLTGVALAGTMLASVGFAVAYALRADTQVLGTGLFLALACAAFAFAVWAKQLLAPEEVCEEREPLPGPEGAREEIARAFGGERDPLARNRVLAGLVAGAAALFGIAVLFPLRSFGRNPAGYRNRTSWKAGLRLVRDDGTPVRADELAIGSVLTAFPDGHVEDADAQTLLIRVPPDALELSGQNLGVAPRGYVAYSKVCTHAGCPVGLYRQASQQLLCPCHQSAFDILDGAKPVSGPAARALPQLPIRIDEAGYVVALGDFLAPVGPDSWERP